MKEDDQNVGLMERIKEALDDSSPEDPLVDIFVSEKGYGEIKEDWDSFVKGIKESGTAEEKAGISGVTLRSHSEVPDGEVRFGYYRERMASHLIRFFGDFVEFMKDDPVNLEVEDLRRLYIQFRWVDFAQRSQPRILRPGGFQVAPPSAGGEGRG